MAMPWDEAPVFCVTCDTDWASDYCLEDLFTLLGGFGIVPTVFATNPSPVLADHEARGSIEVGVHPNFLAGSSHGDGIEAVLDTVFGWFPAARSFRTHAYCESTPILRALHGRGARYDSNLCLFLQPHIEPLRHATGLVRFPVFWEDDVHWERTGGVWDLAHFEEAFTTPGLKVLDVHPFHVATNAPGDEHYQRVKAHTKTMVAAQASELRHPGEGVRTFLVGLCELMRTRGLACRRLSELYALTH